MHCYVFCVLVAGTVPVYLGDSVHLKCVLPHPKAAIFVADFQNNYTALAAYLTYLTTNETAYEEHRQWRYEYNYEKNIANKPILQNSWHCRVCQWAVREAQNMTKFGPNHTGLLDLTFFVLFGDFARSFRALKWTDLHLHRFGCTIIYVLTFVCFSYFLHKSQHHAYSHFLFVHHFSTPNRLPYEAHAHLS